jgi:hypothetical protein
MLGEITETQCDGIRVHTYTAPDDGWRVNTHLIELPTQIIAVDAQYTLRYAREIVDYIGTLGKPLARASILRTTTRTICLAPLLLPLPSMLSRK